MKRESKAERTGRLYARLAKLGLGPAEVTELLAVERRLSRWGERECNGEVERDEETGKTYRVWENWRTRERELYRVPDLETAALRRLARVMQPHRRRLVAYHQTDPRGCAVWIVPRRDIPKGITVDCCYTRGVAVCV